MKNIYSFENPTTGEEFEVTVDISGRHIAATYWEPAEDPEITIETELPAWLSEEEVYHVVRDDMENDYPEPEENDQECGDYYDGHYDGRY